MAYSDAERTEVLIRLALNKYDFDKTAAETGVTVRTIRNWNKNFPKKTIPELLNRAIERLLMIMPEDMAAKDWAVAFGILMDKWLLAQGEPTQRVENISSWIKQIPDSELEKLIEEFVSHATADSQDTSVPAISGESKTG